MLGDAKQLFYRSPGKADPFLVLKFGDKRISDKEHYVSKQVSVFAEIRFAWK